MSYIVLCGVTLNCINGYAVTHCIVHCVCVCVFILLSKGKHIMLCAKCNVTYHVVTFCVVVSIIFL